VVAGPDPADPATAQQARQVPDYTAFLDAGALDGARLGIWREGSAEAGPATAAVLDAAVTRLRERGAQVIDPVHLPDADKISEPEHTALVQATSRGSPRPARPRYAGIRRSPFRLVSWPAFRSG
jgi:amidase